MLIYFIINIYRIKYRLSFPSFPTELFDSIMMKIKTKCYTKETSFIDSYKLKESLLQII